MALNHPCIFDSQKLTGEVISQVEAVNTCRYYSLGVSNFDLSRNHQFHDRICWNIVRQSVLDGEHSVCIDFFAVCEHLRIEEELLFWSKEFVLEIENLIYDIVDVF